MNQPPAQQTSPNNNKSRFASLVIICLLLIAVIGAGFFYWIIISMQRDILSLKAKLQQSQILPQAEIDSTTPKSSSDLLSEVIKSLETKIEQVDNVVNSNQSNNSDKANHYCLCQKPLGLIIASGQLIKSLSTTGQMNSELTIIKNLAGEDSFLKSALSILTELGTNPVYTKSALQDEFRIIMRDIKPQEQTAITQNSNNQLANVLQQFLSKMIIIKKTEATNSLQNQETLKELLILINEGEIDKTVTLISSLPDYQLLDKWLSHAKTYLTAHNTAEGIYNYVTSYEYLSTYTLQPESKS